MSSFPDSDSCVSHEWQIDSETADARLDHFLRDRDVGITRSHLKQLIERGFVLVDGQPEIRPAKKLKAGQKLILLVPEPEPTEAVAEDIPLDIRFEDDVLVVVNKPQGLVVHPAPGHARGTLVNALLFACHPVGGDPIRPGIVHRLDKDTSGLMVIAKRDDVHHHLALQFHNRTVNRRYVVLVAGNPLPSGRWETLHGRKDGDRKQFSTKVTRGKPAISEFETVERFPGAALLRVTLRTGRTHQVRVHCFDHNLPVLGDPWYGPRHLSPALRAIHDALPGQALHAEILGFEHPISGERLFFTVEPPASFTSALDQLRQL